MADIKKHKHTGRAKKGEPGRNPKGRPPVIHPEIQRAIDKNRNAVKELILTCLGMPEDMAAARARKTDLTIVERMLWQCIERTTLDGDVDKFRKLLEIPFGRLPEDKSEFEVSEEERAMIVTLRKRLADERAITTGTEADRRGSVEGPPDV
ncbi:MAG: hypothetical protein IPL34_20170 [Thiofilum sp.]|uniref:hypothetical protein n=1 Tax=Thiofilum sp. TaxID=2212733 RepID=UPI0025DE4778|nr:hypothetical protein [Thiofilum sp.]MBK8455598.1 hypothetical protein [Thiofilum sp.]